MKMHLAWPALRAPALRFAAGFVLANLPFWILGQAHFLSRGVLNLDTMVAVVVLELAPAVGLCLLLVVWLADLALSLAMIFHFATPADFLLAARFGSTLQLDEFLTWEHLALALPFVACAALLLRLTWRRSGMWRPALVLGLILVLADATNGSSLLSDRGTWRLPVNLAGSPVATLFTARQSHAASGAPLRALPLADTAAGLVDIPAWAAQHPERSVLFIVVESLGAPESPELRDWLRQQLLDRSLEQRYEVRSAELPFKGSTTSGELRSLCALAGSYRDLDAAAGAHCLPSQMHQLGWSTVGVHGFSRRMFDREHWWPLTGLQTLHFIDSRLFAAGPRCGSSFRGGCDEQALAQAAQLIQREKQFVYLLTLNTHLPLTPLPVPPDLQGLCARAAVTDEVCELLAALGKVLRQSREAVARSQLSPLVVIVGDHAPPFSRRISREAFSPDKVPAFALLPRQ